MSAILYFVTRSSLLLDEEDAPSTRAFGLAILSLQRSSIASLSSSSWKMSSRQSKKHVAAPQHDVETTLPASQGGDKGTVRQRRTHTSASSSNASESAKHHKQQLSQQQRILRQRKEQQDLEDEQHHVISSHANHAFQELIVKYAKTLLLILVLGVGILAYVAPHLLWKWTRALFWWNKPRQTNRSLATVYPWSVREDLPLTYNAYSIATPDNLPARKVVRHVANLRNRAMDMLDSEKEQYKQRIRLHAWEHDEFERQTQPYMARYCGPQFEEAYYQAQTSSNSLNYKNMTITPTQARQDDLLLWCFLANGHHDGFVKYEMSHLFAPIVRGTKGVAVQRYSAKGAANPKRIHSESFLLLPVHDYKDIKGDSWMWKFVRSAFFLSRKPKKRLPPSSKVGYVTLEWLNVNGGGSLTETAYRKLLEEFLYEWIVEREGSEKWIIFQAACTEEDRQALFPQYLLVGTTCPQLLGNEDEGQGECCHIFDPNQRTSRGHERIWKKSQLVEEGKEDAASSDED